ncbi:MAG: phosphate signaling complex protein PhoU [bacterium]
MTREFHSRLEEIEGRVVAMAALAKENVRQGVEALMSLDEQRANEVRHRGEQLNRMDVELERDLLDLLALHQPVAKDLRAIGASLKIITYLDRIGRYGYDIANAALALKDKEPVRRPPTFPLMADRATAMLDQAMQAYREHDATKARLVRPQDEEVDALDDQIFRQCVTYMMEDARAIGACSHFILVSRHLERVGDNACKIAEKVLYMVTGERRLQV